MTDAPVGARSLGLTGGFCMKEKPIGSSLLLVFNNNNRWYTLYLASKGHQRLQRIPY